MVTEKNELLVVPESIDYPPDRLVFVRRIDPEDRIVDLDRQWLELSRRGVLRVAEGRVMGRPMWDFVTDPNRMLLYRLLLRRVRQDHVCVTIPFRFDGRFVRRFMRMTLAPDRGSVVFRRDVLREIPQVPEPGADQANGDSHSPLPICSWCRMVRMDNDAWVTVEDAIAALDLFGNDPAPMVTHAVCPACYVEFEEFLR